MSAGIDLYLVYSAPMAGSIGILTLGFDSRDYRACLVCLPFWLLLDYLTRCCALIRIVILWFRLELIACLFGLPDYLRVSYALLLWWFPVWGSSNWQSGFMMYSLGISIGWWESILCWARDDTEFGQLVYIVCLLLCSNPCRKYYFHWRGEKHFENVCFVFSSVLCLGW